MSPYDVRGGAMHHSGATHSGYALELIWSKIDHPLQSYARFTENPLDFFDAKKADFYHFYAVPQANDDDCYRQVNIQCMLVGFKTICFAPRLDQ